MGRSSRRRQPAPVARKSQGPLVIVGVGAVVILVVAYLLSSFAGKGGENVNVSEEDLVREFVDWCGQQNITALYHLQQVAPGNYGGVAPRIIQPGETLVRVPREVLLSSQRLAKEVFPKFQDWRDEENIGWPLVVHLLRERNLAHSAIRPYLNVLPRNFPTHPITWEEETLQQAVGTGIDVRVTAIRSYLRSSFNHLREGLFQSGLYPFPSFQWEDFLWAFMVVHTRTWHPQGEGGGTDIVLAPYADMLNHQAGAGYGDIRQPDALDVPAGRVYQKGEQVFVNYGQKSNTELLITYGFVLEDNPDDFVEFTTLLPEAYDSAERMERTIRLESKSVPHALMRYIRQSLLTKADLAKESVQQSLRAGDALPRSLEQIAVQHAHRVIQRAMDAVGTTLETANEMLQREDLLGNERTLWILRKTQLQLLHSTSRRLTEYAKEGEED